MKLKLFDQFQAGELIPPLLQLGTVEPKKNHRTTLEVFRMLRIFFPQMKLLVIGKPGWLSEDIDDILSTGSTEGIEWIRTASKTQVDMLIKTSIALIFPSIVEGWGLPPLEAMAMGTPAITSSIPACLEACGDGAFAAPNPHDVEAFSASIRELLTDRERYADAVRRGLRRARLFDLSTFRRELLELYEVVSKS